MRFLSVLLVPLLLWGATSAAQAGSVIDRVKARGLVRCGSAARPGLATDTGEGQWAGLAVQACRAIAVAVLGSPGRIAYHSYETPKELAVVRNQEDDVFFLTGSEIADQKLGGLVVLGPPIFVESHAVMVASGSRARHVADLAGDSICFMIGSTVERSLEAYFDGLHRAWFRRAFSEEGEMNDTYAVQQCHAIAGEITTLAATRLEPGINQLSSRILPEPLTVFPVLAATGTADGAWSAVVAWTVHTLVNGERSETRWYAGGAGAMPVAAAELGLDTQWQRRVLEAVGDYGAIFERNLGQGSSLMLDRGLNASPLRGGLLLSPFLE